jgi:hypothetical protein
MSGLRLIPPQSDLLHALAHALPGPDMRDQVILLTRLFYGSWPQTPAIRPPTIRR